MKAGSLTGPRAFQFQLVKHWSCSRNLLAMPCEWGDYGQPHVEECSGSEPPPPHPWAASAAICWTTSQTLVMDFHYTGLHKDISCQFMVSSDLFAFVLRQALIKLPGLGWLWTSNPSSLLRSWEYRPVLPNLAKKKKKRRSSMTSFLRRQNIQQFQNN